MINDSSSEAEVYRTSRLLDMIISLGRLGQLFDWRSFWDLTTTWGHCLGFQEPMALDRQFFRSCCISDSDLTPLLRFLLLDSESLVHQRTCFGMKAPKDLR